MCGMLSVLTRLKSFARLLFFFFFKPSKSDDCQHCPCAFGGEYDLVVSARVAMQELER